ncbi:hypothetical protein MNKW57_08650 [Biformimicrobium ophioploci]|uniref:Uncharacterized protein n=1 Tax=Biformimicrobium ophioploci TaxID=3036711 RepID=A0ABQ6LWP9_9GAMM|nr:hypothetical protein MNKW57_08650 [Microbulbifer sp. NKW57]
MLAKNWPPPGLVGRDYDGFSTRIRDQLCRRKKLQIGQRGKGANRAEYGVCRLQFRCGSIVPSKLSTGVGHRPPDYPQK